MHGNMYVVILHVHEAHLSTSITSVLFSEKYNGIFGTEEAKASPALTHISSVGKKVL